MSWTKALGLACLIALCGCGIPPVETTYISTTPAKAQSFAIAQKAVRACTDLTNRDRALSNLRKAGFGVTRQQVRAKSGQTIERVSDSSPDSAVSVLFLGNACYVGLESMTPSQCPSGRWPF